MSISGAMTQAMNVCKFCGAEQQGEDDLGYQCASWRYRGSDIWIQSSVCQQWSLKLRLQHEQTIEVLRKRIATAVEAIEAITRNGIDAEDDALIIEEIQCGEWVWWEDLDVVTDILQGNSPEIPEGSK